MKVFLKFFQSIQDAEVDLARGQRDEEEARGKLFEAKLRLREQTSDRMLRFLFFFENITFFRGKRNVNRCTDVYGKRKTLKDNFKIIIALSARAFFY